MSRPYETPLDTESRMGSLVSLMLIYPARVSNLMKRICDPDYIPNAFDLR